MSIREMRRGAVLGRVRRGEVSVREAAELMGVSYRQGRRLYRRYTERGTKGLVHGNVGRRSNRARPVAERDGVLGLIREHYGGTAAVGAGQRFGPTLVAEHLWTDHGVLVPVTTLTRWMQGAGLWGRVRCRRPRHTRRARKAHFGELVQLDGSFHEWFEGRGPRACVMAMVDDATGRTLLRFGAEETTWAAAGILRAWITQYGVPRALYTDWKTVYLRAPTQREELRGEPALTQFGRMCQKLGIALIGAASPQAKGRVERAHGTHQDRLVKKLRVAGIADCAAANAFADATYLPAHHARFGVAPTSAVDYHTPRNAMQPRDAAVYCVETPRVVSNDYVIHYRGRGLQLDRAARGRVPAQSRVTVRETEAGEVSVVVRDRAGHTRTLAWTLAAPRAKPVPLVASATDTASPGITAQRRPAIPAADHPWRTQHREWATQARRRQALREEQTSAPI